MATTKKNNIKYQDGLAIVEREGLYHLYIANENTDYDKTAPLCVTDKLELPENIKAYKCLVGSDRTRSYLREAICDAVSAMGAGRFDTLDRETLLAYARKAVLAGLEVANSLTPSYAVTCYNVDEDSEDIILKSRTFNDAVAWCAVRVENEDIAILDDAECYYYRVYELNALGEIDEKAPVLYETRAYAL